MRRWLLTASAVLCAGIALLGVLAQPAVAGGRSRADHPVIGNKTPCVYASDHISLLNQFGQRVGRAFQCAVIYNDAAPNWEGWQQPWFTNPIVSDMSWTRWATQPGTRHQLVITQNLFPASEKGTDWLAAGASGAFEPHARVLAQNLVRAGLGHSVIRLAHEANGNWYSDSIPDTPAGDALWVRFWRNTAIAMRSVRGAHFKFDWAVNSGYRPVSLKSFYPGNDVVNIIGIDVFDVGVPTLRDRWAQIYNTRDGIGAVARFAARNHKPLSLPEWGIGPLRSPFLFSAGDDPSFVDGIARVVATHRVAYQAYFDSGDMGVQFLNSPHSIAAYRRHFGAYGNAVPASLRGRHFIPRSRTPFVKVTSGPANGRIVRGHVVRFTFIGARGYNFTCRLDSGPTRPCPSGTDVLAWLTLGYHSWTVQMTDAQDRVSVAARTFVIS